MANNLTGGLSKAQRAGLQCLVGKQDAAVAEISKTKNEIEKEIERGVALLKQIKKDNKWRLRLFRKSSRAESKKKMAEMLHDTIPSLTDRIIVDYYKAYIQGYEKDKQMGETQSIDAKQEMDSEVDNVKIDGNKTELKTLIKQRNETLNKLSAFSRNDSSSTDLVAEKSEVTHF
eukprot:GHVN01092331.1.p1 GENE.GHVN01092331.1~~GHVN01092331.1.p1  ORF type:complete len:174 (+),score=29.41 GHVN01092331.1:243-764(+)